MDVLHKRLKIKKKRYVIIFLMVASITLSFGIYIGKDDIKAIIKEEGKALLNPLGFSYSSFKLSPIGYVKDTSGTLINSILSPAEDIDTLIMDMKYKNWSKLKDKRDAALSLGRLVKTDTDYVAAQLTNNNIKVKVKVRLKGDLLDHLKTNNWSFRAKVNGKKSINGLRVMNIQHPFVRGFYTEPIFFNVMRFYGVLSPRYDFVNYTFNGDDKGITALEEGFSKEMLESSERKEGVLFKFNEDDLWAAKDVLLFRDYRKSLLEVFRGKEINKKTSLVNSRNLAFSLFRGFTEGYLEASEIFDVRLMGKFLAISDSFGAEHGLYWNNIRFYFNPATLKIEPVAYDADIQQHIPNNYLVYDLLINNGGERSAAELANLDFIRSIISDKVIFKSYISSLNEISNMSSDDVNKFIRYETKIKNILIKDFPLLYTKSGIDNVIFNATDNVEKWNNFLNSTKKCDNDSITCMDESLEKKYILKINKSSSIFNNRSENLIFPSYLNLYFNRLESTLEVINKIPHDIKIKSICSALVDDNNACLTENEFILQAGRYGVTNFQKKDLSHEFIKSLNTSHEVKVVFSINGNLFSKNVLVKSIPAALRVNLYDKMFDDLSSKEFVKISGNDIVIKSGDWTINDTIFIPLNHNLIINGGTSLNFESDASILSLGNVYFKGSKDNKIYMSGIDGHSWEGVTVIGSDSKLRFIIKNSEITDVKNFNQNGVNYSGGLNAVNVQLTISNSVLSNSTSEDLFNIISSKFEIRDSVIFNAEFDAIDSDFSLGNINNLKLYNIGHSGGGDAIDLSGSKVSARDISILDVNDKAISVGENSYFNGNNIVIENSKIGIASKDGSKVVVKGSRIFNSTIAGLMAFSKKDEYSGGEIC